MADVFLQVALWPLDKNPICALKPMYSFAAHKMEVSDTKTRQLHGFEVYIFKGLRVTGRYISTDHLHRHYSNK